MEIQDMKLYSLNTLALGISMTNIEVSLRIILLVVTIVYTIIKIKNEFSINTSMSDLHKCSYYIIPNT